jgi:hypothetical protein
MQPRDAGGATKSRQLPLMQAGIAQAESNAVGGSFHGDLAEPGRWRIEPATNGLYGSEASNLFCRWGRLSTALVSSALVECVDKWRSRPIPRVNRCVRVVGVEFARDRAGVFELRRPIAFGVIRVGVALGVGRLAVVDSTVLPSVFRLPVAS